MTVGTIFQKNIYLLWIGAFLSSLFFLNDFELESFGLAALLLFSWSILKLSSPTQWQIPKSYFIYLLAAFWWLTFISVLFSDILNTSIIAFVYFSALPIGFFTLLITAKGEDYKALFTLLAVIFSGLGVWALCQYFFLFDLYGGRAHHPLKNANSLGALFNFGLFGALGWMVCAKNKVHGNLALLLAIIMIWAMMATVSRGAILAMGVMAIPMLFLWRAQVKKHWRCFGAIGVSVLVFIGISMSYKSGIHQIASRLIETAMFDGGENISHRWQIWAATWQMIKTHGIWGTGIGTYFQYFPQFRLFDDVWGTYYAHNDFLQYWVELGVLGPVLLYALCFVVLGRTIQACKATTDKTQHIKILTPFFAMGAIILHTHVTFNFYNLSILYMSGLTLAYWFYQTQKILQTPVIQIECFKSYGLPSRIAVIALPFLCVGYFFFSMMISEHLTQKAKQFLWAGEFDDFANTVISAQTIGMGHNYRADLLAVNMPITLLSKGGYLDVAQKKEIFDQGLSYARRAHFVNPRSASALYYLGLIQEDVPQNFIPEDLKSPLEYYLATLKLDPLHFNARLKVARDLPPAEALKLLEAGTQYNYNNPQAVALYMDLMARYVVAGDAAKMSAMREKVQYYQKFFHN